MTSAAPLFPHTQDQLKEIAAGILRCAAQGGASSAAVEISEGSGFSVTVRRGALETIERHRDQAAGVTIWIGTRRGDASTNDLSPDMRLKMPAPDWRTLIVWKARRPRSTCFIPGVSIQKRRLNWRAAPNRPRSMQARGFAIRKAQPSAHSTASLYSRPVTVFWPVIHIRAIAFHALRLRSTASIC